ncbi:MAG TPA: MATE family efflux transporter [Clostridiales bacterium]|jgi:putative MATE family efflux protein|nr:MATE family efflux transporter [Clostridiales bacterium]
MTATPIPKLVTSMAIPTVVSMLIMSIYNMADTFFVSQLGTSAGGAVGIVFPIMTIIQSLGFTIAIGASSMVSRTLGEKNDKAADTYASTAFFTALFVGAVIAAIGLSFINPLMKLLGATPTILPYARDYGQYIFIGAPFMCCSYVMNNALRAEGKATFSMVGLSAGGILNIILDPIFIFTFGLGTAGAAIATIISQFISFLILLSFYVGRKSLVVIRIKDISRSFSTYYTIFTVGMPSFFRQGLATIASIFLNVAASAYGDAAIAAISINNRIFMLILSVVLGIGQGFMPVCGYNFGAKIYNRVRESYWFALKLGTVIVATLSVIGLIFAPQVMAVFRDDPQVIEIGSFIMRIQCAVMVLHPLLMVSTMLFQSTGSSLSGTFLSMCRQGIYFIPLINILPRLFGLRGVQITQTCADVLCFLTCIPLVINFFRRLKRLEAEAQPQESKNQEKESISI